MQEYPWTRIKDTPERRGESAQAYGAFQEYLRLGSVRSIRAVGEALGQSADSHLRKWSAQWDWVNRSAAYDTYLMTAQVDGDIDDFTKVRTKHLDVASKLLDHLAEAMLMWKPGADPSIRWTTAFTAAAKVQHAALTLKESLSKSDDAAIARILEIMAKKSES